MHQLSIPIEAPPPPRLAADRRIAIASGNPAAYERGYRDGLDAADSALRQMKASGEYRTMSPAQRGALHRRLAYAGVDATRGVYRIGVRDAARAFWSAHCLYQERP